MAIYAISDLHLSYGVGDKPMNIFGNKWDNYEEKIKEEWMKTVKPDDIVILSGDFSWATYMEETKKDFDFLNELPGKKIMIKGNHDYWWTTVKKMNEYMKINNYQNINFLYNNAYDLCDYLLAGTRYWGYDEDTEDNDKIYNREIIRAKISLDTAVNINKEKPIIFTTHYPPDERIISALKDYNIAFWIYGHIHTKYEENLVTIPGIRTYLTSCDYLDFRIQRII